MYIIYVYVHIYDILDVREERDNIYLFSQRSLHGLPCFTWTPLFHSAHQYMHEIYICIHAYICMWYTYLHMYVIYICIHVCDIHMYTWTPLFHSAHLCMYVIYICIHAYICMWYTYVCRYVIYICIHGLLCFTAHTYICMYICMWYTHVYTPIYVCDIHMYICMYICMWYTYDYMDSLVSQHTSIYVCSIHMYTRYLDVREEINNSFLQRALTYFKTHDIFELRHGNYKPTRWRKSRDDGVRHKIHHEPQQGRRKDVYHAWHESNRWGVTPEFGVVLFGLEIAVVGTRGPRLGQQHAIHPLAQLVAHRHALRNEQRHNGYRPNPHLPRSARQKVHHKWRKPAVQSRHEWEPCHIRVYMYVIYIWLHWLPSFTAHIYICMWYTYVLPPQMGALPHPRTPCIICCIYVYFFDIHSIHNRSSSLTCAHYVLYTRIPATSAYPIPCGMSMQPTTTPACKSLRNFSVVYLGIHSSTGNRSIRKRHMKAHVHAS